MQKMTIADIHDLLSGHIHTAKLATVRADGRPHVASIWYAIDGAGEQFQLVFTSWHETVKVANLRRDPRVCLIVDDETPPFAFVQIEGTAAISDDMAALKQWATVIGGKYMGADKAEAFGTRNAVPGELLIRVTPTKIIGTKDMAG
ncbi:MAG: PPOX class F420-dependent oxidoreductase [Anaerolineae bacterium]|nr:PPOX class F420-dependent oxidoreductase [Anaerolineae bacterium]